MTQATYDFALDLDRDGFFNKGVSTSDLLNLVPTAAQHTKIAYGILNSATSVTQTKETTLYGLNYYRVVSGTTVNAGMRFGSSPTDAVDDIPVVQGESYRAIVWVRAVGTAVGMTFEVTDQGGASVGSTTFTPTSNWGQVVASVTTGAGDTYVDFRIRKTNSATNVTFDVAGFMLVFNVGDAPTVFNAGDGSNAFDQINTYILGATWSNGLGDSYDEMARPNRATLTLNNSSGLFFPEIEGAELVTNPGNPFAFSSDNPVGWTISGESGGNEISEVGSDESHGESGTGYINVYTTGASIKLWPTSLAFNSSLYKVVLTINKVTTGGVYIVANDIFGYDVAISPVYMTAGEKTVFVFGGYYGTVRIVSSGACDVTIKSFSVKSVSVYADIGQGMPLRIMASFGSTLNQQLYVGQVANIQIDPGLYSPRKVAITADDMWIDLQGIDFAPMLQTDVTTDQVIQTVFDDIDLVYPPATNFWILGVEGNSEPGVSTILFDSTTLTELDTGATTLAFAGDNADTGNGVKAYGYLEQIVAGEMGGRFFWDTRSNRFVFHSRHRDITNETIFASLTEDDFENGAYYFGDTLVNDLTINYQAREVGSEGAIVWSADSPIELAPLEQKVMTVRYRDPDQNVARIGVLEGIVPAAGVDYTAWRLPESTVGREQTKKVSVSARYAAMSAEVALVNNRADVSVYIHDLQIRGTPLRTFNRQVYRLADGASYRDNRLRPKSFTLLAVSDEDDIQAYASFYISRFKDRAGRYANLNFIANKSDARMTNALTAAIGSRISFTDSQTGHDSDYIVVGEQHQITPGGDDPHQVTWILKSIARESYWILGVVGKSELGSTTRLAF